MCGSKLQPKYGGTLAGGLDCGSHTNVVLATGVFRIAAVKTGTKDVAPGAFAWGLPLTKTVLELVGFGEGSASALSRQRRAVGLAVTLGVSV